MRAINLFCNLMIIIGVYLIVFTEIKQVEVSNEPLNITIQVQPEVVSYSISQPEIDTSNKDTFVLTLNQCVDHLYSQLPQSQHIPKEILIAQAALETGWGSSRFANEGNNLFGIRTFNKDSKWLLPITWDQNKWIGWGVKVYDTKCDSVRDYVRIINEVWAYEELRKVRDNGGNVYEMADHLTLYASKPTYTKLIKQLIKYNIEGVYDL